MNTRLFILFLAGISLMVFVLSFILGLESALLFVGIMFLIGLSGTFIIISVEVALERKNILFKIFELIEKWTILFFVYVLISGLYELYIEATGYYKLLLIIITAFVITYRIQKYIISEEQYS